MRILSVVLLLSLGLFYRVNAQVDLTTAVADPKTFIFDDGKHTVHGEVYRQLKEFSSCCGNDAIYLEVKFGEDGIVSSAKTLTGKNDCYKKSVIDIIRNVRWNTTGVSGSKTIYFEVKPIIPCSGSPGENEYKSIAGSVPAIASNEESSVSNAKDPVEEVIEEEVMEEVEEELVEEAEEVVAEVEETTDWNSDSFLSDAGSDESNGNGKDAIKNNAPTSGKDAIKNNTEVASSGKDAIKNKDVPVVAKNNAVTPPKPATAYSGPVKIPPQATDIKYVSKGERSPTDSHQTTFLNENIPDLQVPKYADGEGQFALQIRKSLRESGFCGLAQGLMEIEISPAGQVVNSRILAANTEEVRKTIPGIVSKLRYSPQGSGQNYRIYQEFKTEIVCKGQKPMYQNLEEVPNIIKNPNSKP